MSARDRRKIRASRGYPSSPTWDRIPRVFSGRGSAFEPRRDQGVYFPLVPAVLTVPSYRHGRQDLSLRLAAKPGPRVDGDSR